MVNHAILDEVYSALADPTRRGMIERLRSMPLTVSELGAPLDMTLAAVGKHVTVLERAGIVRSSKTGRVRSCALVVERLDDAARWIAEQRADWESRLDRLEQHLEQEA